MNQIIECVPNFSEGRNKNIIDQIISEIISTDGVYLLDVDPGKDTNRTVVTFVGAPDEVIEAAFRCIKKAAELINMAEHTGAHPRMGATDVCPLIPVKGVLFLSSRSVIPLTIKAVSSVLPPLILRPWMPACNPMRINI